MPKSQIRAGGDCKLQSNRAIGEPQNTSEIATEPPVHLLRVAPEIAAENTVIRIAVISHR